MIASLNDMLVTVFTMTTCIIYTRVRSNIMSTKQMRFCDIIFLLSAEHYCVDASLNANDMKIIPVN